MSFGIPELLLVLVIVLLLFGTSKLKSFGSDFGSAIKGFKSALGTDEEKARLEADEPAAGAKAAEQPRKVEAEKE
ncbi:MAG: twin-arginine translocase TatA/TatE family subunit [Pseudomonadota bacterium]